MKKQLPLAATPGRESIAQGFQPTIPQVVEQLSVEVNSLKERLAAGDIEGEPAAYQGVRVFSPESSAFLYDVAQLGPSRFHSDQKVNYVLRDGAMYDIPILAPGPGVFIATGLVVAITQRHYVPWLSEPLQQNYDSLWTAFSPDQGWTTKFSLWPRQPNPFLLLNAGNAPAPTINFFWNLLDARTGDLYADQMVNHLVLRPRSSVPGARRPGVFIDGGMFQFDTPWVFPYGTGAVFKFQPITPILQYDSSVGPGENAAGSGLSYDDRENGKRNQAVTVKAILHGYRMMVAPSPTP